MNKIYYFGCGLRETGHYLHNIDLITIDEFSLKLPFKWEKLDCGFCPKDNEVNNQEQGIIKSTKIDEWLILSFWDRSMDKRFGSHSTFLCKTNEGKKELLSRSKKCYPKIFKRIEFKLRFIKDLTDK